MSVINKSTSDIFFDSKRWLGSDGNFYAMQELSAKKFDLKQQFSAVCIEDKNGKMNYWFDEIS